MSKKRKYIIFLLFLFIIVLGGNQIVYSDDKVIYDNEIVKNDAVNFQSLTVKDGISNDYITKILQDSRGYMWIGTADGLNRYDGSGVRIYNYSYEDEKSLNSTYITALAEDSNGNMWVGTGGGLSIINMKTNEVTRIGNNYNSDYSISNYHVTAIFKDNNNTMWVGTSDGLNMYDEQTGKFRKYYAEEGNSNSLTNSYITDIKEFKDGNIVVATKSGATYIDINTFEINKMKDIHENNKYIYSIDFDNDYKTWYSTKSGIYYINDNKIQSVYFDVDIGERINTDISYILCDSQENIWFASSNGLIKYEQKDDITKVYKTDKEVSNSLLSNYITYVYEDRNGVIWIGTDNGVSILNNTQQFNKKYNYLLHNLGISESSVTSILEDSHGDIWVGTKYNGVFCFNEETNETIRYVHDDTMEQSLSSNSINHLHEVEPGKIMLSTDESVDVILKEDGTIQNINKNRLGEAANKNYLKFYYDGQSTWVGSNEGFYIHKNGGNLAKSYNSHFEEYGLSNYRVIDIFQDEEDENILWLAGGRYTGLIKFHKEEGIIKNYTSDDNNNDLTYDTINCIQGDGNGNLWIGTNAGLNKFNIETETFTNYSKKDGLANDYINSLLIDDEGNLWIGTNNGLSKFNIKKQKFTNYSEADGLQGTLFNRGAAYKTKSGKMFFGTNKGIISFNPSEIKEEIYNEDKVVLGNIRVNNQLIDYDDNEIIKLNHNENNIEIKYFLPDYGRIGGVSYTYMLEGVDSDWQYPENRNNAIYTLLSPGNYTFKVRGIKSNGDITEETSLNFIVKSPIWRTKTAFILYFIIIAAIVIYVRNHVKILKAIVDRQTKEINAQMETNRELYERNIKNEKFKNDYFVNLSHELRTPINIIIATVQLVRTLVGKDNLYNENREKYLNIITKSSNNLLGIINDIIDSSKIESGAYKIKKQEGIDIVYLVEETALGMSSLISEKGIELIIDPEIEEKIICCDPNEIERCIINLIGNAVKFTEEGGEIRVFIKDYGELVSISVEDTGLGISLEDQKFIFNRFEQGENMNSTQVSSSGIGLTLVKYIVELHNGKVTLESELNKGSKFTIILPV
ncbi:ligand-binding sensor domain-containing protein [Clostridium disporicum]|uniref:histidine kinase n=1 Tax=Clostridium disporicum TaxID=84024 RepID=A0A174ANL2_9CLOT|nr:two-component regulator propeller domain-containing protein [Clostridium disporicum]CUN90037.1 sensor histidine kinase/response regulator [Clostridium disporicum]